MRELRDDETSSVILHAFLGRRATKRSNVLLLKVSLITPIFERRLITIQTFFSTIYFRNNSSRLTEIKKRKPKQCRKEYLRMKNNYLTKRRDNYSSLFVEYSTVKYTSITTRNIICYRKIQTQSWKLVLTFR